MWQSSWLRSLRSRLAKSTNSRRRITRAARRKSVHLTMERLEDRTVPTTFTVTNTLDSGAGSLRQAILDADATNGGADRIEFNIGPAYQNPDGSCTIEPLTLLPVVTDNGLVIDGYTQPGASVNTLVQGENAVLDVVLDLSQLPQVYSDASTGLQLAGDNMEVRGLVVNQAAAYGIDVSSGSGDLIDGNFIGTDDTGKVNLGNGDGVHIDAAVGTIIGGPTPDARNMIAGNVTGVLDNGQNTTVTGNWIGLGANALSLPNGIGINNGPSSSGLLVGGTASGAGNVISGNTNQGIDVQGSDGVVQGNYVGLDPTGTVGIGNGTGNYNSHAGAGVNITGPNCVIGGDVQGACNVISGNEEGIFGGPNSLVVGNYIGTDYTGTQAIVGGVATVWGVAGASQVGGTTAAERNVIVGASYGVNNCGVVSGNWIGLGADGSPIGNFTGVLDCDIIGGTSPGAGNVISDNSCGIWLSGYNFTTPVLVEGNFIGTDPTGTSQIGNDEGILLSSPNNVIGGTAPGARNIISGNNVGILAGVYAPGTGAQDNVIQGNYFGTDVTGTQPIGNGTAIELEDGASNNLIGGTQAGNSNLIAFNNLGVEFGGSPVPEGNAVLGNSIFANPAGGIALDDGSNNSQSYPVLTSATVLTTGTTIAGTLNSLPDTTYRVELFANGATGPSGYGEGEVYLGFTNVTTDDNGDASFSVSFPDFDPTRLHISSTATQLEDTGGTLVPTDTSQFSTDIAADLSANAGGPYFVTYGNNLTLDGSGSHSALGNPLTYSWTINGHAGAASGVQPTLSWSQLQTLGVTFVSNGTSVSDGPFTVGLTVNDGHGDVAMAPNSSVMVNPLPANAGGPYFITYGNNLALDGSKSASTLGGTLTYSWTINGHADAAGGYGVAQPILSWQQLQALGITLGGPFTIGLTVNDGVGDVVTAPSTSLTVNPIVPHTFTVANTLDSGAGSLRQAILDANANDGGADTIDFDIGVAYQNADGSCTIQPLTPLPYITDNGLVIDGYTQPGASVNTLTQGENAVLKVELDFAQIPLQVENEGLQLYANNIEVRGLVINQAQDCGILVQGGSGDLIDGNFIGTDLTGTLNLGNEETGVQVVFAVGTIIGGSTPAAQNVISGNSFVGVQDSGASTTIEGNAISYNSGNGGVFSNAGATIANNIISDNNGNGVEGSGTIANNIISDNSGSGVVNYGANDTIANNIIAGNNSTGVVNYGANATITGNSIGLGVDGSPQPNKSEILFNGGNVNYDGSPQSPALSSVYGGTVFGSGSFVVTYNGSTTVPTDAGTYAVAATYTSSYPNNLFAQYIGSFTIAPAMPMITLAADEFVYDGDAHAATAPQQQG